MYSQVRNSIIHLTLQHTLLRSTSELLCLNNLVCSFCKLPFWQSYLFWSLSHKRVTLNPVQTYQISLCDMMVMVWLIVLPCPPVPALTCLSLLDCVLEYLNEWTNISNFNSNFNEINEIFPQLRHNMPTDCYPFIDWYCMSNCH